MSGAIKIRAARGDDAVLLATLGGVVQELHFRERPDVFKPTDVVALEGWFRATLAAGHAMVWIAELGGMPVGYAVVVEHRRDENVFCHERRWHEVEQLGVHPGHRRHGVARALLQHALTSATEAGANEVELNTWIFNQAAHRAFERVGFAARNLRFERRLRTLNP